MENQTNSMLISRPLQEKGTNPRHCSDLPQLTLNALAFLYQLSLRARRFAPRALILPGFHAI